MHTLAEGPLTSGGAPYFETAQEIGRLFLEPSEMGSNEKAKAFGMLRIWADEAYKYFVYTPYTKFLFNKLNESIVAS